MSGNPIVKLEKEISMTHKDYFSGHSSLYATFRPSYSNDLYDFILSHVKNRRRVWDCATGNGQVATHLASHFDEVYATDISAQQLEHAIQKSNISYTVSPAENTHFPEDHFDLITVGQALHWFNREAFYNEVKRVGKNQAYLAIWGYSMLSINTQVDAIIMDFYNNIVGPFWDNARRLVEQEYSTIDFPFEDVQHNHFSIKVRWTRGQLTGYLQSWSATQQYIKAHGKNPVTEVTAALASSWNDIEVKDISFPVFLKLGRIAK